MKKKVYWVINQYASTPKTGMGGRHYYLAKNLAKQGHRVYLVASGYTHLLHQPPELYEKFTTIEIDEGFYFIWIKMPAYHNAHDKKRILNWFKFTYNLLKLPKIIADKPDVILASSPAPFIFLSAQYLAKKYKAKLVFEVRDIWPLSLIELGGYSPKHPFIRLVQWVEDRAYRDADMVLSNLPNAVEHMVARGMNSEKFQWIPNGFDLAEFENMEPLDDIVQSALPKDKFIIGYTGTLGIANALDVLIKAAKILKNEQDVVFVLVGAGKEKLSLLEEARGLSNVVFIDPIPKTQIQSMLATFDVCFFGLQNISVFKYGIAPNKIPEYMLASKPILQSFTGYNYIRDAKCGLSVESGNFELLAQAILQFKNMSAGELLKLGENGRSYALKNHDYAKLAKKLSQVTS